MMMLGMVDLAALRRLALALPEVEASQEGAQLAFDVHGKAIVWPYLVRAHPKARREPVEGVIAVRCARETKDMLLEAAPDRFFDDDHSRGYPAVLVRLEAIDEDEWAGLLTQAWRILAPRALVKRIDAARSGTANLDGDFP